MFGRPKGYRDCGDFQKQEWNAANQPSGSCRTTPAPESRVATDKAKEELKEAKKDLEAKDKDKDTTNEV